MQVTLTKDACEQYYMQSKDYSFTTFTISKKGDLFVYGDWGYYSYNWRSFGDDFKRFLVEMEFEYFLAKIQSNASLYKKDKINPKQKESIKFFFEEFKKVLNAELSLVTETVNG